jgi:hypothetical protein
MEVLRSAIGTHKTARWPAGRTERESGCRLEQTWHLFMVIHIGKMSRAIWLGASNKSRCKFGEHWGESGIGGRVQKTSLITNTLLVDHVAHLVVAIIPGIFEARNCLTRSALPPCLRAEK